MKITEQNTNEKAKTFLLILVFIVIAVLIILQEGNEMKNEEKKIASYNLKLSGTIIKKKEFNYGHGFCFILINTEKCNYNYFDPRRKEDEYFFIKTDNKCMLATDFYTDIQIGDRIEVDGNKYVITRNNVIIVDSILCHLKSGLGFNEDFPDWI